MEEEKRRRPTVAQLKALEAELSSQSECVSRLVADCDAWRKKYRSLLVRQKNAVMMHEGVVEESARMSADLRELRQRLAEISAERDRLAGECEILRREKADLESRLSGGFFSRLFCRR